MGLLLLPPDWEKREEGERQKEIETDKLMWLQIQTE